MPLVDNENQLHDSKLTDQFNQHFSGGNKGNLVDSNGNFWYVCQDDEFSKLLSFLESNIGLPLGRVFHNSAADTFELILTSLNRVNFGLFARRNRNRMILEMWETFGWGSFDIKNNKINTNFNATCITGFYLATIEYYNQSRYKIQWRQISETLITCELNQLDRSLNAPMDVPHMPWMNASLKTREANEILIERKAHGWSIDGKQSFVLPCNMVNRIIYNTGGYSDNINKVIDEYWLLEGIEQRLHSAIKAMLQSCKELLLASDVYVFLNDANNWDAIIKTHLEPYGLGSVRFDRSTNTADYFVFDLTPNAILSIGKISGLWERANGRQSVCFVKMTDKQFTVSIQSRLDYNHSYGKEH